MNAKEKLITYLNNEISKGLTQISGAIFVDRKVGERQLKANTTVEEFVHGMSDDHADAFMKSFIALDEGRYVDLEEVSELVEKWLALGEPDRRPSNRDLVQADKVDINLLHDLASFVLLEERSA